MQWLTFKPGSPRSGVRFQEEPREGEGSDRLQRDARGAEQGAQQQVSSPGRIVVLTISHPLVIRTNPLDWIVDIREHDMPHHVRTSIDKELFVGSWY